MKSFIALEAKLNTEARNNLPAEMFGLPRDRQYPLTDEEHVRKAIQFFKHAPVKKRNELSNNINRRAKQLGMQLKVGKDSPFYRYLDKKFVTESYSDDMLDCLSDNGVEEVQTLIDEINHKFSLTLSMMFSNLFNKGSLDSLKDIENDVRPIFIDSEFKTKVHDMVTRGIHAVNPFELINGVMYESYKMTLRFISYNAEVDTTNSRLLYDIVEDIFFCLKDSCYAADHVTFKNRMDTLRIIVRDYPCNFYHIHRKLIELDFFIYMQMNQMSVAMSDSNGRLDYTQDREYMRFMTAQTNSTMDPVKTYLGKSTILIDPYTASGYINELTSKDFKLASITGNLRVMKSELESEIDIIKMSANSIVRDMKAENTYYNLDDIVDFDNAAVINTITYLDGAISDENVKMYNKDLTLKLTPSDIVRFNKVNEYDRLFVGSDCDGEPVYYGVSKDKLYLLTKKTNDSHEYYLLTLYDGVKLGNESNLVCSENNFDRTHKMKAIKIMAIPGFQQSQTNMDILTEGFFVDSDGNMKFKFNPKKSYMDDYAENHKILVANSKSNNTEGMKRNLAFLFALINQIEREVMYSTKPNKLTQEYSDHARKARTFAINDFKTYIKEVQKADPSFDFTKYYEESDYGKLVVSVNKEEILGIKKLFRALMLS